MPQGAGMEAQGGSVGAGGVGRPNSFRWSEVVGSPAMGYFVDNDCMDDDGGGDEDDDGGMNYALNSDLWTVRKKDAQRSWSHNKKEWTLGLDRL